MNFAIGNTEYYDSLGFDTSHWRKSVDETKAVVHYNQVRFIADESKITVYRHDDKSFSDLMMSEEWTKQLAEE